MSVVFAILDNHASYCWHCVGEYGDVVSYVYVLLITVLWLQLLFSLHHYDGDDRIKDFIFDLVSSTVDGQEKDYRNHTGTVLELY